MGMVEHVLCSKVKRNKEKFVTALAAGDKMSFFCL